MHVRCRLRQLRNLMPGDVSLRDMEERTGISRGTLSQLERGILLPLDRQIDALEHGYGAPIVAWYDPHALLALQTGDGEE
ncbi:MAG TPA: helix-turn-helix transcriptional regulator [Gaiellaceae bacterium]|nr:helix-turn-helix transcriptional regulator [Gaiellaceae bacterium]